MLRDQKANKGNKYIKNYSEYLAKMSSHSSKEVQRSMIELGTTLSSVVPTFLVLHCRWLESKTPHKIY